MNGQDLFEKIKEANTFSDILTSINATNTDKQSKFGNL